LQIQASQRRALLRLTVHRRRSRRWRAPVACIVHNIRLSRSHARLPITACQERT
jgi:hypothetical protein